MNADAIRVGDLVHVRDHGLGVVAAKAQEVPGHGMYVPVRLNDFHSSVVTVPCDNVSPADEEQT